MGEREAEGEIGARARPSEEPQSEDLVRHEERLSLGRREEERGAVRARKRVETRRVEEAVPRRVERLREPERTGPNEEDSGEIETLPDGSLSIPLLEEELVITKRTVVRERVIIRKESEIEDERIEAELRRERIELEREGDTEIRTGGADTGERSE